MLKRDAAIFNQAKPGSAALIMFKRYPPLTLHLGEFQRKENQWKT
jgi:hypothetical protein